MSTPIDQIVAQLEAAFKDATPGEWCKGLSTHHTVSKIPGRADYKIAEFHHAADAAFCDLAHAHMATLLAALALSQPVQPASDAKDAEIARLRGIVSAWKKEAEYQYGQLRLQRDPTETDYPVDGALDAYARVKYAALREAISIKETP